MKTLFKWIYTKALNYNLFMLEETDYDDDNDMKDSAIVLKHQKTKTWLYVVLLTGKYTIQEIFYTKDVYCGLIKVRF